MSECMGDPYAAQIRAAKAEGELAHIKDELREFAEDNGFNPELEPRDLLAKATGAFRSCAAMSDARYEEIERLKDEMEAMRPRLMPEGMEWPRYEDGETVMLNDVALLANGLQEEVYQVHFHGSGFALYTETSDVDYSYGERVKRPAVRAADGEPLEVGQTVWHVEDGTEWCVTKAKDGKVFIAFEAFAAEECDPSLLTHQRPVLDADGVPIREGDTVYGTVEGGPFIVTEVSGKGSVSVDAFPDTGMHGSMLTHTKPEPTDSAERIAEDIKRMAEEWCSHPSLREASEMAARSVGEATMGVALGNLSKRCRALAERERGE